jgi:hypothetical protein
MSAAQPNPPNAANPVSPKTKWGTLAAAAVPIVLIGVASLIEYLVSPQGQVLFEQLPDWVKVLVTAVLAAVGVAIASYRARDPLRREALIARGVPPEQT